MGLGTNDTGGWLDVLYGVIGFLWVALLGAYGLLLRAVATKEWVKDRIAEEAERDRVRDRILFTDLLAPIMTDIATQTLRHHENQELLLKILENQLQAAQLLAKK